MNIHRLIFSLAVLIFAGGIVVGGTGAFFSDEETSTGNVFAAGEIDLKVDSEAHYNRMVCVRDGDDGYWWKPEEEFNPEPGHYPAPESPCNGTWTETDLGPTHTFFSYEDLKPGDHGENTLSLHVTNNDAYACAVIDNMKDDDLGLTEPEEEDGDTTDGVGNGELSQYLRFFAWDDDGNNVWEENEQVLFANEEGPASDVIDGVSYPLYTPDTSVMEASSTEYIGLYWCFGQITVDYGEHTLACDGGPVNNIPQSDRLEADITFYVEQSRNNDAFECPLPGPTTRVLVLENKDGNWNEIDDGIEGTLQYDTAGNEFTYDLNATGLAEETNYSLIYAPDPWPQGVGIAKGDGSGTEVTEIASGATDGSGVLALIGSTNLDYDLPHPFDDNHPGGAKIWVVLSADHSGTSMTAWNPSAYLFEHNLITYDDTDAL